MLIKGQLIENCGTDAWLSDEDFKTSNVKIQTNH